MRYRLIDRLRKGVVDPNSYIARESSIDFSRRGRAANQLRIGYLNPWKGMAENQAFHSIEIAASRLGHELVHVANSDEIESAGLDFVLAVSSVQAKTTNVPTFGVVHAARNVLLESEGFFQNLLSYDGYLTISDSLRGFLQAFSSGFGKSCGVGNYYNVPQSQIASRQAPIVQIARSSGLRLCYFGTNWDPRTRPLFKALAQRDYTRIYGPEAAWTYLQGKAYCGATPFDGESVQMEYMRYGVGLVVLSRDHLLDDVISNRIFEISSVGAVSICPDIPWIRKNFGDTVLYYPPFVSVKKIVDTIDRHMADIAAKPELAAEQARNARWIFEEQFSAEKLLSNSVAYFDAWKETDGRISDPAGDPLIDVIVRTGGRALDLVERTIRSIDDQMAGRFRIIFVRYKPVDLRPIVDAPRKRIQDFEILDCMGGNRAATLTAGLKAVSSEYFAVLDDDDRWLSHHIKSLLKAAAKSTKGRVYAHSGFLEERALPAGEKPGDVERRRISQCSPCSGSLGEILARLSSSAFLASSDLLKFVDLNHWALNTAEDSVMHGLLIAHADPVFAWTASALNSVGQADQSNHNEAPTRNEDVFECFTRLGGNIARMEQKFAGQSIPAWQRIGGAIRDIFAKKSLDAAGNADRLVFEDGMLGESVHEREGMERRELLLNAPLVWMSEKSARIEVEAAPAISILPNPHPWAYGCVLTLKQEDLFPGTQWAVLEFDRAYGNYAVGLIVPGQDFITRMQLPLTKQPVEVWFEINRAKPEYAVVVQNFSDVSEEPAILRRAWLVRRAEPQQTAKAS